MKLRIPTRLPTLCLVILAAVSTLGCPSALTTALANIKNLTGMSNNEVAIVLVSANDGAVYPDTLVVRRGVHAIAWVSDGQIASIDFQAPAPSVKARCQPEIGICIAPVVAAGENPARYEYTITVNTSGGGTKSLGGSGTGSSRKTKKIDPRMEVVM